MLARIVLRTVAACGVLALTIAMPATAHANWGTTARIAVGLRETYNDSLFIRSGDATVSSQHQGDAITTIEPAVTLTYQTDRSHHDLTWGISFQKFASHGELDNVETRALLESYIDNSPRTNTTITNLLVYGDINTVSESAAPGVVEPGQGGALNSGAQNYVFDLLRGALEHDWSETTTVRVRGSVETFKPIAEAGADPTVSAGAMGFEAGPEIEWEYPRDVYRVSATANYALLDQRPDYLGGEVRGRVIHDLTDRIEARLELGAAFATDAAHRRDIFYGPVGMARFKYENERQRIIAALEHGIGANVEYRTIEAEDTISLETEYVLRDDWYAYGGVSGNLRRFVLPGAGGTSDFQRIGAVSLDLGLEWQMSEALYLTAHYQGRIQRASTQLLPSGLNLPFDLDYTRNLVTIGLEISLPAEPRPPRLATTEE